MHEIDSAFEGAQQLIDWAKAAINEADEVASAFINDDNYTPLIHHNPESGRSTLIIRQIEPIPEIVTRRLTEALNNLRNSFDQSLFAACKAINQPVKDAHYPWADNAGVDLKWKLEGKPTAKPKIPPDLWGVIRSQHPYPTGDGYPGGDDVIRQLATLANRKHTIGFEIGTQINGTKIMMRQPTATNLTFRPEWNSVENHLELFFWQYGQPEPKLDCDLGLHITFDAPPPVGQLTASDALEAFTNKAQGVLDGFKARAVELRSA
jgi:hypothetical protein